MHFPIWAIFGLGAALGAAVVMVLQERIRARGFGLAFWNKIMCIAVMAPFVYTMGLPDNPVFYAIVCTQAVLWTVSDVVLFNIIPVYGAGVVSRIMPLSIIATFFFWLPFDNALVDSYIGSPALSGAIVLVLAGVTYFGFRLRRCEISKGALKAALPCLFAAIIGPAFAKLAMGQDDIARAPFAYIFIEAIAMTLMWAGYAAIRKPMPRAEFFSPRMIKSGMLVGAVSSGVVACGLFSVHYAANPAYTTAMRLLAAVFIVIIYRLIRHEDRGDVLAGMGIVACAMALVLLDAVQG